MPLLLQILASCSLDQGNRTIQALREGLPPLPPDLALEILEMLPFKAQNRKADLGMAMGEGTGAAREVAGLVLASNRLDLVRLALAEGRSIVNNLRQAAGLFLCKNVFSLLLILIGPALLGWPFPYLPQQVTLLNFLIIGGPVFLILWIRQPVPRAGPFLRAVGRFALFLGSVMGLAGLALFSLAHSWFPGQISLQRTLLLSLLILLGLANLFRLVPGRNGKPAPGEMWLGAWAVLALGGLVLVQYNSGLAWFFALEPLNPGHWVLTLAVFLPALVLFWMGEYWGIGFYAVSPRSDSSRGEE